MVYVEDGCGLNIRNYVEDSVMILPVMVGDKPLRDLRRLSEVVIPEGVETIESNWFSHSDIESVTIPKSVKVIEKYAFYKCEKLNRVSFQEESQLERIGQGCFWGTGIQRIVIPRGVKEIQEHTF